MTKFRYTTAETGTEFTSTRNDIAYVMTILTGESGRLAIRKSVSYKTIADWAEFHRQDHIDRFGADPLKVDDIVRVEAACIEEG